MQSSGATPEAGPSDIVEKIAIVYGPFAGRVVVNSTLYGEYVFRRLSSTYCRAAASPHAPNDDDGQGGYICFSGPNDAGLCEPCDSESNPCAGGSACVTGECVRYCCEDGDCGTGTCDTTTYAETMGPIGLCTKTPA